MTQPCRHVLVVGASGVIGSAAVEHYASRPGWQVTALSRRRPLVREDCTFKHLSVDLEDRAACAAGLVGTPAITHMIYAAVREAPGLVSGWNDPEVMQANAKMFANILDCVADELEHLVLLQGVKAYGAHRHDVTTPLRESGPRDDHLNFYWLQEDIARRKAEEAGFAWTIFRPQILLGAAPGAAMNPVLAIGAYAALCKALGRGFVYPGAPGVLWELVDAGLLAEAFEWAALSPGAAGQTFNITNGDVFAPSQAWPQLSASLGLSYAEGSLPNGVVDFLGQDECVAAWTQLAERHGLVEASLPRLLGQSHHYLGLLLSARVAEKPLPVLLSTIKLRQAGFSPCRDSAMSLDYWLRRLVEFRVLPPFD